MLLSCLILWLFRFKDCCCYSASFTAASFVCLVDPDIEFPIGALCVCVCVCADCEKTSDTKARQGASGRNRFVLLCSPVLHCPLLHHCLCVCVLAESCCWQRILTSRIYILNVVVNGLQLPEAGWLLLRRTSPFLCLSVSVCLFGCLIISASLLLFAAHFRVLVVVVVVAVRYNAIIDADAFFCLQNNDVLGAGVRRAV